MTGEVSLRTLIQFIKEHATVGELISPYGIMSIVDSITNDLKILEIIKNHLIVMPRVGLGTEKYNDIILVPCEYEEDAEKIEEWLDKQCGIKKN